MKTKDIIKVKDIIDEDFSNYKKPSMFIAMGTCNWKCCKESNIPIETCQNNHLFSQKDIPMKVSEIYNRYIFNNITSAIVIGGLEPMTQFDDIISLISYFRSNNCADTFVIYTGYYSHEITKEINEIKKYNNVIFKFGRYKPNNKSHYDEVLGVNLISDNQKGEVVC